MSHKQGKFNPANQKANVSPNNRNPFVCNFDFEDAMEVEQSDFNSNMPSNDTSEHDRSPNLLNDERPQNWYNVNSGGHNPLLSDTLNEQADDFVGAYDENDEARSSGVVEAVFENISHHKQMAARGDIRIVEGETIVRCLPWRVLLILHSPAVHSTVGVFVQCNADSDSQTWSCTAKALIQLVSHRSDCAHKEMKIQHTFTHKENDWGFQQFISYDDLFNPERGFISVVDGKETIKIRAHIKADAPHGADWDSKRHTGFVGLKNQGATCYLNSLLQAFFFTLKLRRAVFLMPTESDDAQTSVPLALQRVFYELQFSKRAVGTKKLTRSFGWPTFDSFMQHDVQELCRVLLDNVENKMKGTSVEDVIPTLFSGKMMSYINCLNVPYSSKREEKFYDVQLKVNGNASVYEAFREYIAKETLTQDNKYDAGAFGLQEAEKGVIFTHFPPVLYLQLMRFQYDINTDANIKLNDRFEFPYILKLDEFLASGAPSRYILHAVLVHSGDNHGGHYVVYINPSLNGAWYQFDDDVVSRCSKHDAIDMNFGGSTDPDARSYTNAYMLVYIDETAKDDVLCPVSETDIPESLRERFVDEQRLEEAKRKQKEKVHLYAAICLVLEEDFYGWQGPDLCSQESLPSRLLRVHKQSMRPKLIEDVAGVLNCRPDTIRLWRFQPRRKNMPAHLIELGDNQPLCTIKDALIFFVQCNIREREQPPIEKHLFFLKFFDPYNWTLAFCGSTELRRDETLRALDPVIKRRAGLAPNHKLSVYQDDAKGQLTEVTLDVPINKLFKRELQGQVLYFQVKPINSSIPLPFGLLKIAENKEVVNQSDEAINSNTERTGSLYNNNHRTVERLSSENANGLLSLPLPSVTTDALTIQTSMDATGSENTDLPVVDSIATNNQFIDTVTLYKMATFPAAISSSLSPMTIANKQVDSQTRSASQPINAPTVHDYIGSYLRQFEILLVDKLRPYDAGMLIHVSTDLTYWEFASVAALHLSTEKDRLQFFRSQQGFGNTVDPICAPIYVSPVGPTATGLPGSEVGSPQIGSDNANTTGPNNGGPLDSNNGACGIAGSRSLYTNPHSQAANASGFSNCSPYMNSLVVAAAAQGLAKEPPGAAIPSTHYGPMQDFFLPFSATPVNSSWGTDGVIMAGLGIGGNQLTSGTGLNQIPDRFPAPLNRYCASFIANRSPFGPVTFSPPRRVYYAHLAIKIEELETMRQVRVIYVGPKLSEKADLILSVPQNGLVSNLLKEASRHLMLPSGGSGQLRLLKVSRNRIIQEYPPNYKLSMIPESTVFPQTYGGATPVHSLRIEEIPSDEMNLKPGEIVVYVSHFDKAFTETFGIPFTVRICDGEPYSSIRERIRRRLDVPEKEFDRWRFAVIFPNEGAYVPNEDDPVVNIRSFTNCVPESRPWLGIDHKPSKRPRYAPNEKPIKIHN